MPPSLDEAVQYWTGAESYPLARDAIDAILGGHLVTGDAGEVARRLLLGLAERGVAAPTLHRGLDRGATAQVVEAMARGATHLTVHPRSWTTRRRVAEHFADGLVLTLAAGARGLSVASWSTHPLEAEWITAGTWRITDYRGDRLWLSPTRSERQ